MIWQCSHALVAIANYFCANSKLHLSLVLFNCIRESLLLRAGPQTVGANSFLCLFPILDFFLYWFVSFPHKHFYFDHKLISTLFFTKLESNLLGTKICAKYLYIVLLECFLIFQFLNASNLLCLDIASFNYNCIKKGKKSCFLSIIEKRIEKSLIVVMNYT